MAKSALWKRSLSGLVLVVVVVEMTVISPLTFWLLWSVIGGWCLGEYWSLLSRRGASLWTGNDKKASSAPVRKVAWYGLGGLYILTAIGTVFSMQEDPMLVVTLMTIIWAADTGAYLIGTAIGKHKMAPKISPNKSWEGFFGGLLFGVGIALIWYALYWKLDADMMIHAWGEGTRLKLLWAGFGLTVALAAVGGDLIESKFKRLIGIKDSGSIIPGHGGMLDRFDALLLAAPAAVLYLLLTGLI